MREKKKLILSITGTATVEVDVDEGFNPDDLNPADVAGAIPDGVTMENFHVVDMVCQDARPEEVPALQIQDDGSVVKARRCPHCEDGVCPPELHTCERCFEELLEQHR